MININKLWNENKDMKTNNQSICKTQLFKDILSDIIYSFRQSVLTYTDGNIEIKLSKIRTQPIPYSSRDTKIEGKIINLIGGRISCVLGNKFVEFINKHLVENTDTPIEFLMENVFDIFSNVSKNEIFELCLVSDEFNWDKNTYFIQYDIKIFINNEAFQSKLIIAIDEMTSMYFGN